MIADLDCFWSDTYHTGGSADRLRALTDRHPLVGITHYAAERNDGWLLSDDADALFAFAAERHLIVSLSATTEWQADLRILARRHPSVPVLCHVLGAVSGAEGIDSPGMTEVLASAEVSNICLKVAGMHYLAERGWDYPWPDMVSLLERLHAVYGPRRLLWGSDFPAGARFCTFRQTLEVVRTHCRFLDRDDLRMILGENLRTMLATGQAAG